MQSKRPHDEPQNIHYSVDGIECTQEEWNKKLGSIFELLASKFEKPQNESEQEEWTKYFVNDIECKRDDIYQTILDNQFYTGQINLDKKYHFKKHEKQVKEEASHSTSTAEFKRDVSTQDQSKNYSANFGLNTKEFAAKFGHTSEDYKLLVERMVHALDMFYECQNNYQDYAKNLRLAIINCMQFITEKVSDCKSPYNDVIQELSLEYFALIFDLLACAAAKIKTLSDANQDENDFNNPEIPSSAFDLSSIKEAWDEKWSNIKKSQFLDKYISVMLEQVDLVGQLWMQSDLFMDDSSKKDIQDKFDVFKTFIKSMQDKKASHDATIPEVREHLSSYRISSISHFKPANTQTMDTSVSAEANCSLKI